MDNKIDNSFRILFEQSPVGSVVVGLDKKFQKCNASFCRFIGYSEDELIGKTIAEITLPEDMNLGMNELKLMAEGKINNATVEKRYVRKDGSIVWGEVSISIVRDFNNKPLYFLPIIQNITQRKLAEKKLRESKDYLDNIINSIASPIFVKDDKLKFCLVNKALCTLLNLPAEKLMGNTGYENFPKEQNEVFLAKDMEVLSSGKENISEEFLTDGKGDIRTIITRKTLYTDLEGNKYIVGVINDITEIKKAEEVAKKEQSLSNAIIESIPGTFYMLDQTGKYVRWNAYQRDEIVGKPDDMVGSTSALDTIHPDDRGLIQSKIANVLANGADETVEGRVLLRGGPESRWLVMTGRRMMIEGHPFLVGIGIDISGLKQAEYELAKYRDNLEQIVKERTKELEEKNEKLAKFNKLFVDREFRIKELKDRIKELEEKFKGNGSD